MTQNHDAFLHEVIALSSSSSRRSTASPAAGTDRLMRSASAQSQQDAVHSMTAMLQHHTLKSRTTIFDLPTEVFRHVDGYLSSHDILNMMRTSRLICHQFYDFTSEDFDRLTERFFGLAMSMDAWSLQTPLQKQLMRSQRLKKLLCLFIEVEAQAAILVAVRPRRLDARDLFIRRTVLGECYCYAVMDALAGKLLSSSSFDANKLHQRMQRKRISDTQQRRRVS